MSSKVNFGKLLLVLSFVSILTETRSAVTPPACTADSQQTSCICNLLDGSGKIDLSPLVQQSATKPFSGNTIKANYLLTFCSVITGSPSLNQCNNVASSCESTKTPISNSDIGEPGSTRFEIRSNSFNPTPMLALVMDSSKSTKRTVAYLKCDPQATDPPKLVPHGHSSDDPDGFAVYDMDMTSAYFCPIPSGSSLSVGSILLITFFSVLSVYFIGGLLIQSFYFKKEGVERIPNNTFWSSLPSLAKEGVLYSYNAIRKCASGGNKNYNEI